MARDPCRFHHAADYEPLWPPSLLPPGGRPLPGVWPPIGVEECCGVDECCEGAAGLWALPAEGMLGRGAIGGGGAAGRGAAGAAVMGLGAGGAMGRGAGGATGLGAGAAIGGRGAGAAIGLGAAGFGAAGFGAAALGFAAALRPFGFAFLAADFLRALFFATARFFLRATATFFFVFFDFFAFAFFDFLVFDFAFFAMIVLPIVSAQISVRLSVRLEAPPPRRNLPCRQERSRPCGSIPCCAGCRAPGTHEIQSIRHRPAATVHQLAVNGYCPSAPQACDLPSPNRSARPCEPPGSPCPPQSG
jgi:hypothetical protein